MAILNSTQVNGKLTVNNKIKEDGFLLEKKYAGKITVNSGTLQLTSPDGTLIGSIKFPGY